MLQVFFMEEYMFDRLEKILDKDTLFFIQSMRIVIIGLGGVGGHALDAITRFGIKNILIIDNDDFEESNLNRQLLANSKTIGRAKVDVAKKYTELVNKNIKVEVLKEFILKDNCHKILEYKPDYIIDACDTVTTKIELIKLAIKNNIGIISCMGTGNKFHPEKLEITSIWKTSYDSLAKIIRKKLNEEGIKNEVAVVSSKEEAISLKDNIPGSNALVPSCAGILCASYVINDAIKKYGN